MRKLVFITTLCFIAISQNVIGQTEKGTLLLGGNGSFESQGGESAFLLNPNVGIFLADNYAAGLSATLLTGSGNTIWGLGPYGRAYFGSSEKGKLYAQAGVNLLGFSNDFGSDTEFGWTIGAGYAVFLNQSIALELGPQYSKIGDSDGRFNINVGFQIHFNKN